MEAFYTYEKRRAEFGRQCKFEDFDSTILESKDSNTDGKSYIIQNPCVARLDTTPETSSTTVSTAPILRKDMGMQHTEGGWPSEVDVDDPGALERFRKKREKGTMQKSGAVIEPLGQSIKKLSPGLVSAVKQNNTIDIYEEYFAGYKPLLDHASVPPSAKGLAVFRDPCDIRRTATTIDWQPSSSYSEARIAVAYSILKFQDPRLLSKSMPTKSYLWDISKPNTPELTFAPQSPLCCLKFNPKQPDVLVGGCYNGLVCVFDRRSSARSSSGNKPERSSKIEKSHYDPVFDVHWTQSKTGTICSSCSTDGRVLWWDTRKLVEPQNEIELKQEDSDKTLGACSMAYSTEAGPTKYLIGTEQGVVVSVNTRSRGQPVSFYSQGAGKHHSAINSIERNPTHSKYFMTVGDWTARIWSEDLKTPIMTTKYHPAYLTAGCWSPTRQGVFFVTRQDGVLDMWDYFYRQNDVALSHKLGDSGLSSISVHKRGALLAIGDDQGTVSLLEVSDSLSRANPNEKLAMSSMFERETQREKNLIVLAKEQKRREIQAQKEKKRNEDDKTADTKMEELLLKLDKEFLELAETKKDTLGGKKGAAADPRVK